MKQSMESIFNKFWELGSGFHYNEREVIYAVINWYNDSFIWLYSPPHYCDCNKYAPYEMHTKTLVIVMYRGNYVDNG